MRKVLKITAIFTVKETTLTITTSEVLLFEQMGHPDKPIKLREGETKLVVQEGVFRILSMEPVRVTANTPEFHVSAGDKDGPPGDPPKFVIRADPVVVHQFLNPALSEPSPT